MRRRQERSAAGRSAAAWIPLVYFTLSAAYVAVSDGLLAAWVRGPDEFERWSTAKGWAFLALSALGLHLGLRRVLGQREAAAERAGRLEQQARELVEHSPDAILVVERWTVAYANPSAARLFGAPDPAALVGRTIEDFLDPSEFASVRERQTLVEEGRPYPPVRQRLMRRLDGERFRAEVAISNVSVDRTVAIQVTIRDVTSAWLLQEEVRRVNGALRTLGAVNEALVRAGSERELMEEVCRIAVELGGYQAAWVGLPGEGGRLAMVACHGTGDQHLGAVGLDWTQAVRPEGMAATAGRTGQSVVVNDFAAIAPGHPHAAAMARLGWRSAASLPMRHGDEPQGALTLLAGEPAAFDPPVLQLLQQLGDDLAFGLAALRTRAVLAREREFLEAILQNAGVLVSVMDRRGTLVRVNQQYERLTGWRAEELVGRPVWERLLPPEVGEAYRRAWPAHLARPFPQVAHAPLLTRDGRTREVEWVQTALGGAAGRPEFIVGIGHDVTEQSLADQALRASREQLRALAGRLQSVREEEKARMARDLHDELGQLLTGLKMDLRWLERRLSDLPPAGDVNLLVDRAVAASELADQTVASVQRIAAELRPGALDRLGLVPALRQELRHFQARTGLACEARLDEAAPEPPPEVATALYRICQEALTNVTRHAAAGRVIVSLSAEPPGLVLRVEDDGRGFDAAAQGPGALGLLGMTERATLLGGDVQFARRPGGGTVVTARVPLPAAPPEAT
jgi:two-component system sensor histidine kinase UhpB